VSPKGNQILFDSVRDGNLELYVMNADGSNPVRLTNFAGEDYMGAWASTGKQIVFVSNRMQGEHLWRMNADGSGLAQLTSGAGFDTWPSSLPALDADRAPVRGCVGQPMAGNIAGQCSTPRHYFLRR
jgi:TolB protein